MEIFLQESESRLQHSLNSLFPAIRAFKTLRRLKSSALYREHREEIRRVEAGIEWQNRFDSREPKNRLRVAAWNVERGRNLAGIIRFLTNHEHLSQTDVLLLTETDIGMGRSGNRNVPREIAAALKMNYCFANSFIVLSKGDEGEQEHELENTLSLHGVAILSRCRIISCKNPALYEVRDHFRSFEKRLGKRRGLICKLQVGNREYDFATAHLELKASPLQRALQIGSLLKELVESDSPAQLFGGDLNTHTYNLQNRLTALAGLCYRILFPGVEGTIAHYLNPEWYFEKPLFEMFARYGFDTASFNERGRGTLFYDLNDMAALLKTRNYLPDQLIRWLRRQLEPWKGKIPLHLDWMAGRGFKVFPEKCAERLPPQIIPLPYGEGERLSDHCPIFADVEIGAP
ncbi:MAG: hypothetical protein HUU32_09540 [Calditrichaceae bacterium]|nr:hypothetical protein [Calditrichia bacterium]NUQ41622.1 hypothetical protein [Calditrichaceae bacterium]